jgi:phage gpG-like protein
VIELVAKVAGEREMTATLRGMVERTGPPGRGRLLAAIGQRVALRHMPATIRENRPGWAKPSSFYRAWRSGGQPLVDTGRLVNSWAWRSTQSDVKVFTQVRYARQLNLGGVIRPRGKFLLIPQSPPLKMTEARGWPTGKAAIAARYPGSFFLFHGPEGPGIYRKSRTRIGSNLSSRTARYKGGTLGIERIAAGVRQIRQKGYHFGHWRQDWMPDLLAVAGHFITTGQGGSSSASGGTPDKGARGGQVS